MTAGRARQPVAADARPGHVVGMPRKDKDREREERLAAALRENLRRRKAQAWAQDESRESETKS